MTGLYETGGVDVLVVTGERGERLVPLAPYVDGGPGGGTDRGGPAGGASGREPGGREGAADGTRVTWPQAGGRDPDAVPADVLGVPRREHPREGAGERPRRGARCRTSASTPRAGTGSTDDAPYGGGAGHGDEARAARRRHRGGPGAAPGGAGGADEPARRAASTRRWRGGWREHGQAGPGVRAVRGRRRAGAGRASTWRCRSGTSC